MSSNRELIVARMSAALSGMLPNAIPVYRSREQAFSRDELPAVVVKPGDEETIAISELMEMSRLNIHVEIIVRGDPWDCLADPIIIAAHGLLLNDFPLSALCSKIRRTTAKWEPHEADQTAGVLTQTYHVQYRSQINQL
jgi:hypothetical protein